MNQVFDFISFILTISYSLVFFQILHTFLPLRKSSFLRIPAFLACEILSTMIIYSGDLDNLLGTLLGFALYLIIFHSGSWREKLSCLLVFYPSLIAVNYLVEDTGRRFFFHTTGAPSGSTLGWTKEQILLDAAVHALSFLLRLLFWIMAWQFLKKYLRQITSRLTTGMWMVVNILMLSPFVAIFTIIYFMPTNPLIIYPICGTSIFSSFGCIYLASYICNSMQTTYRARELEKKQAYYQERMEEEERVRSIYHDLKNHLLVLQAQAKNGQEVQSSVTALQEQISEYENYYHTGNDFLDMVIRDKASAARKKQIDFSSNISFADSGFIDPLDISTLFGNALDNAIEASEKLPKENRLITVKAGRIRDMLVITVENNTLPALSSSQKTTKADPFLHGFGLSNIRKAAERYGGECSIRTDHEMFTLKILIPIP